MNMVTVVYQLEGEGDKLQYTPIHENSAQTVKVSLLNTKKVIIMPRCACASEVYGSVFVCVCVCVCVRVCVCVCVCVRVCV